MQKIYLIVNERGSIIYRTNVLDTAMAEARQRRHYTGRHYTVHSMSPVWSTETETKETETT
jgi:hypothetical protein